MSTSPAAGSRTPGGAERSLALPEGASGFGGFIPFLELERAYGDPPLSGRLRSEPEDFLVAEDLGFDPAGSGAHHWLLVRKVQCTTAFAARRLAERFAVPEREVGYSGLKDRHAVATQWFSVPARAGAREAEPAEVAPGVRIVRAERGRKKLRRGVHARNRFTIVVREVRGDLNAFAHRIGKVAREGVPSYFGAQRFGRGGGNVASAARMLQGRAHRGRRLTRGLYLSAARSLLFNRVLHHRVEAREWNAWLRGDAVVIAGRLRALAPDAAPREGGTAHDWVSARRAHPTGPLWGRGSSGEVAAEALARERAALRGCGGWQAGLEAAGLAPARRALRVIPSELDWRQAPDGGIVVRFSLPRGAFATAVMRELVEERRPR